MVDFRQKAFANAKLIYSGNMGEAIRNIAVQCDDNLDQLVMVFAIVVYYYYLVGNLPISEGKASLDNIESLLESQDPQIREGYFMDLRPLLMEIFETKNGPRGPKEEELCLWTCNDIARIADKG